MLAGTATRSRSPRHRFRRKSGHRAISGRHFPFHLKQTLSWICSPSGSIDEARFLNTIAKRDEPSVQARCHFLAEAREVIGEIKNLRIVDGSEHPGHDAVVAVPSIVLILAHRLDEIVLALVGDARNTFAAGQIQIVAVVTT